VAEPRALDGMSWDDRQELKEGVCDAVLERTRRIVSGEGMDGEVILGEKPSRVLSSGFILPRLSEDGDDESSDIKIAAHGMDIRLRNVGTGTLRIRPSFFVYVRTLPAAAELFARNGRLIPRADFNDAARAQINGTIDRRAGAEIPPNTRRPERAERRAAISREVYSSMGIGVPQDAQLPGGDERTLDDPGGEGTPPPPVVGGRLQIPDQLSRRYEIPQKWTRLSVDVSELVLQLPFSRETWDSCASMYKAHLLQTIRDTYITWIASADGQTNAWRKVRPPSEAFWSEDAWERFLSGTRTRAPDARELVPAFDIQLLIQALADPLDRDTFSLRIAVENLRDADASMECGVFELAISLQISSPALRPMRLERVRRSYHLAGFMSMPAIGVNGGVVDLGTTDGFRRLRTTWMPRYVLPRMQAAEISAVPTAYATLASQNTNLNDLTALSGEMARWINHVEQNTPLSQAGEEGSVADEAAQRTRFREDLQAWHREATRIQKGVDLLVRSQAAWRETPGTLAAVPYRAWLLLNQTFSDANPLQPNEPPPGWRLFQLAFVLAHVSTLASRIPGFENDFDAEFDEDSASLLYMSTGGGKTEAFFGVLVYALVLDRLRGKHRGLTAMMHYPLRLLTVQQAQRLARLLARAEIVRRREGLGGSAFEIGFWVGSSNTPNATERRSGEVLDALRCIPVWNDVRAGSEAALMGSRDPLDRQYAAAKEVWNKLPVCPFCGSEEGTALRRFPERHNRLGIVCLNNECEWNCANPGNPGAEPLPFLLADSDIYRRAPSVLLGTIDKLALLGQNTRTVDRIAGMLGMARFVEGGVDGLLEMPTGVIAGASPAAGCDRVAPAYQGGIEVFFDPFPSLIVQDEMHLLEESLGTFGGIFETGLFAWLSYLAPLLGTRACHMPGDPGRTRLPHVIGATATAADAAKHTRALYQRRVVQFPHPGPALHGGFYTRVAAFQCGGDAETARATADDSARGREASAPWGRVYASLMTNGRLHTVTALSVLTAHAATITRWQRDLASADALRQARAAEEMEQSVSDAPWSERRRGAIRATAAGGRYDRLAALVDLHRIELTYVTNKKGGDQILSALDSEVRDAHAAMGRDYVIDAFQMELISGGVDIGEIQQVIRRAEHAFDPMSDNISGALRGIVATSAISHGVDVEAFNAMAFMGMPSDVAEYIQASSRVGRAHVGFSLLVPTPQTRRDRFVVEIHETFHRLLERMIAPPAVERWADQAIVRTIPSLVQTWLAGIRHQQRFVSAPIEQKGSVSVPATVEQVDRLLRDDTAFGDCVRFVMSAVGIDAVTGDSNNPQHYSDLVRAAVSRIRSTIASGEFTGPLGDFWENRHTNLPRPMTSLRDVDAPGRIQASDRTERSRPISWDDVGAAMAMVRNRGAARHRVSAGSELDGEA
jgi:hypothetical protein